MFVLAKASQKRTRRVQNRNKLKIVDGLEPWFETNKWLTKLLHIVLAMTTASLTTCSTGAESKLTLANHVGARASNGKQRQEGVVALEQI